MIYKLTSVFIRCQLETHIHDLNTQNS